MASHGRSPLRDLFDDAPTPHIAHPPRTHKRDYYIATDGSFFEDRAGLGAIVESGSGECLARIATRDDAPDNNVAEYRALGMGLDTLLEHAPHADRVGVLVDHDDLAANINATTLGMAHPDWPASPATVPDATIELWQDIQQHIDSFADLRAACVKSDQNPAHVLANAPDEYTHVNDFTPPNHGDSFGGQAWEIPPPSRADRHADD